MQNFYNGMKELINTDMSPESALRALRGDPLYVINLGASSIDEDTMLREFGKSYAANKLRKR